MKKDELVCSKSVPNGRRYVVSNKKVSPNLPELFNKMRAKIRLSIILSPTSGVRMSVQVNYIEREVQLGGNVSNRSYISAPTESRAQVTVLEALTVTNFSWKLQQKRR